MRRASAALVRRASAALVLAAALGAGALLAHPPAARAAAFSEVLAEPAVVWLSGGPPAAAAAALEMRQTARAFVPELLVVPVGASVAFPNDDGFYHSVYSLSPSNPFDLGLYDKGPGKSVTFAAPGVVEVRCHVHAGMRATILVVDGPYARTTAPGERVRLDGLRPGRYTVHLWTAERGETTRAVRLR